MPRKKLNILLLSDNPNVLGVDLDILYPRQVTKLNFTQNAHGVRTLQKYDCVITMVCNGEMVKKLNYGAVTSYAKSGGKVMSCLFEYAENRGLHFSKTYVGEHPRPSMFIEAENDITRGYAIGNEVWWFGIVSGAGDLLYCNQMLQRQVSGVKESESVTILGTSNINRGAVMLEEKVGKGRIIALDLRSLGRPYFNSWGSTNKYLFLGNLVNGAVRYGKHYPKRLSYDDFVDEMRAHADRIPALSMQAEGASSDGSEMWSLNIGDESNPTVFLGAAVHGWEWENSYGLLRLAEILCEDPNIEGLDTSRLHFKIMPVQSPWAFEHFTRQNARGVDLNRNFDCGWEKLIDNQDVPMPWDYNYKGPKPASERETQVIQSIIDRHLPLCVIDFHTADYILLHPYKGDLKLIESIQREIRRRLKDRYLCQRPYGGPYQQVNMDRILKSSDSNPYLIDYAASRGVPAAFLIEMSGNRDDTHALVMNTDTVVEICLAAVKKCLAHTRR